MKTKNYVICPICGKHKFPVWENNGINICPHCGWGYDSCAEEYPDEPIAGNDLSLNDFKLRYKYYISQNPQYHWNKDIFPDIIQVENTLCPVCKKFKFQPISWDDLLCGIKPSDVYCMHCGWKYDEQQLDNHTLKNGTNELSVNELRELYKNKVSNNPNYDYYEEMINNYVPTPHNCPVCGEYEFKDNFSHDICHICGWEDDGTEEGNEYEYSGANDTTIKKAKQEFNQKRKENPKYKWKNDKKRN